jgi:hypothetical protein
MYMQCRLVGAWWIPMHGVRRGKVQELDWNCRLQQLPGRQKLDCAEYSFGRLHWNLQSRLVGTWWRPMHGVRPRHVQERGWIYLLQQLPTGLKLACAEYSFDRMHLRCRLVGDQWRHLHGVRPSEVQEHAWIYRLYQLPYPLKLACAEYSFGSVHLQCRLVGTWWRPMHGVRCGQVQECVRIERLRRLPGGLKLACAE